MFCYQCEQTARGTGCTVKGVCGKEGDIAGFQDVLVQLAKGVAWFADRAAKLGAQDGCVDAFVYKALFTTVTNVNFDGTRLQEILAEALPVRAKAQSMYEEACRAAGKTPDMPTGVATWQPETSANELLAQAQTIGVESRKELFGEDIGGLIELVTYGLKGAAAYADHAHVLGFDDASLAAGFHALLNLLTRPALTADDLLGAALQTGELNLRAMELLDKANTETYGHPEPTTVRVTPVAGKCILVSGHDLKDLAQLLAQTDGTGIKVYTHGEMLPCCAYPGIKKYKHLAGNYGGAWQDQQKEFDAFPGAILMTTNCIQKPRESYQGRIFTTGLVAFPGVTHIQDAAQGVKDFSAVIAAAKAAPGFAADEPEKTITVGFGHQAVMNVAGAVVDAVKAGDIRHFFLIGGCDGAKPGRNYYTDFASAVPQDCVILTLACGKYRFNKMQFGSIGGIPRLLDIGQCNDAYSAIQIAVALAKAFDCGVNELPLSLVLSWYEQKAVAILLTLLYLGIQNIRIGPSLPAFVTPTVLGILVDKFHLAPVSTPEADLKAILG